MGAALDDSSFKVPDVFVVPPAEDRVPVWRCFNASNLEVVEERSFEVEDQDVESLLNDIAGSKASSEASKSPETPSAAGSRQNGEDNSDRATADTDSDAYYGSEYDEDTQEDHDQLRNGQHHALTRFRRQESLSDTASDVIEVVKVSRSHRGTDPNPGQQQAPSQGLKRSSTFKSKASKALRTLTIAFRSSKTKPRVEELAAPSRPASRNKLLDEEQQQPLTEAAVPLPDSPPQTPIEELPPRTPAAKMTRRISQIFSVSTIGRSRSGTITRSSTTPEDRPTSPPPRPSLSSRNTPTSGSYNTLPSRKTRESPAVSSPSTDYEEPPSTLGKRSKSTFSRANLKTFFNFAPNEQGQLANSQNESSAPSKSSIDSDEDGRTTPTLKRKSSLPSTSSDSSAGPLTPRTTGDSPVRVGSSVSESTSMAHELEGLGEGDLGILPSEGSFRPKPSSAAPRPSVSSSESGEDGEQPPLYRRFSSSTYRSSMESTRTKTVASKPPTLPPIHQLDYMTSTSDLVGVRDFNVAAASKAEEEEQAEQDGDVSMEMRLDSLHFDSLSFDADQFVLDLEEIKDGR